MRNEEKNKWLQKFSSLPPVRVSSLTAWLKFGVLALGCYVWGLDFIWTVLGAVCCYKILRGILPRFLPYNHDKVHLIIRRNTTDTPAQSYGR